VLLIGRIICHAKLICVRDTAVAVRLVGWHGEVVALATVVWGEY
jgi:hypothetical protein